MQHFTAGQANTIHADLVARADGTPITGGTVNFYLVAASGSNVGKWFKTSDDTWSPTEAVAAVATHKADGHWTASIDTAAWTVGVRYQFYAKESGNLHIPYSEEITERNVEANVTVQTTVTE